MATASRQKGMAGQREVATLLRDAGAHVTALRDTSSEADAGQADYLAAFEAVTFTVECKRAERWKMGEWQAQLAASLIPGTVPLLALRRNHSPWYGLVPLITLAGMAAQVSNGR